MACVGHAPNLDLVAARLTGADPSSLRIKKAGAVLLELESDVAASLIAFLPPRVLRLLAGTAERSA